MKSFFRKLSWLARRRNKERELREELQFHLEEEAEQRRAEGAPADEARLAARRDLGNVTLVGEDTRSAWGWTMVEQFGQDLRYAFRTMSATKSFSLLAMLTLAAWHWGEYGDLLFHGLDPVAVPPGGRSRIVSCVELAPLQGCAGIRRP